MEYSIKQYESIEKSEEMLSPEQQDPMVETYDRFSAEAGQSGAEDMQAYYEAKKQKLIEDKKAYYEAKKQKILEEQQQRQQEWAMDKAVHGAPDYAGFGGWRESEYIYEAEKEYAKNGNSAEYRRLLQGAAKAHVREEYGDILK